jgi:tellurite resistance protein TerC
MAFSHDETEGKGVDENFVVRMIRRFLPVTNRLHGEAFIAREDGRRVFTPLFVVLVVIESTDLLFAIDSIPAVLGILPVQMPIEDKRFIAFTSNIFAIMGLRSMYFAISGFMHLFRFLKPALSFILVFIGVKMILPWAATVGEPEGQFAGWAQALVHDGRVHIPTSVSLSIIGFVLALAIALSVAFPKKK